MNAAMQAAWQLWETWSHLPFSERFEQIEAHMESDGFSDKEIAYAIDEIDHETADAQMAALFA